MEKIYKFFGGRKLFCFYILLLINVIALFTNKFDSEFANFSIMLGSVYVIGNIGAKFSGGKGE
jgi:nitrate/nitrite transporter NarK